VKAQTFRVYEPFLFVAVGYFLATLAIEWAFRIFERRFAKTHRP
jgi:ABC-type amino acid transport system permease subunit